MSEFLSRLLHMNKKCNRSSSTKADAHTSVTFIGHAVDERRLLLHTASKSSARNHWYTTGGLNQRIRKKSKCTQMHANARKCTQMHANARKCTQMHANAHVTKAESMKQHIVAKAPKRSSDDSEGQYLFFNSAHVQNPFLLAQIVPKIM
jgi:hypothetical protein